MYQSVRYAESPLYRLHNEMIEGLYAIYTNEGHRPEAV